jgi:long-chain acyl-CoA synthetase
MLREYASPLTVDVPATGSITDDVVAAAAEAPQTVLFGRPAGGDWTDVTASEFRDEVAGVAGGLIASGIEPGDRVLLLSRTRYEWTLFDYALWWCGAVTVPVYETSSEDQVAWVLEDSGAVAAVVETDDHLARVRRATGITQIWQIESGAVTALAAAGAEVSEEEVEKRRTAVTPDSLATLIYTSGTTGRPKGCELTHGNFMFELGVAVDALRPLFSAERSSTLLFLPLAHVFARIIQVGVIKARARLGHSPDATQLLDDLAAFQPTFILAVPRVFEKVYNSASQKAQIEGRGRIFDAATSTAIAYSRALDGRRIRLPLRLRHLLFDRLVYAKLRAALGGRIEYAISGGAPLGDRLTHFFRGIGLTVIEGYGLSETTGALTANRVEAQKIGTVGQPLPGTSVRVADDGELLFKGGQVLRAYWKNEQATAEAFDPGGWFRTGDLGELDDDGFVRIIGRKKEILVTAGGKNVAPAPLEDTIRAHYLVSQALVVGEARPFVAALITIDTETFAEWRDKAGKSGSVADLHDDPDLVAEIQSAVDAANSGVSKAEAIRKFAIVPYDWTEEGGQVTPTLKLRRNVVLRESRADVESLYS